jgi:hypothetical protein
VRTHHEFQHSGEASTKNSWDVIREPLKSALEFLNGVFRFAEDSKIARTWK